MLNQELRLVTICNVWQPVTGNSLERVLGSVLRHVTGVVRRLQYDLAGKEWVMVSLYY